MFVTLLSNWFFFWFSFFWLLQAISVYVRLIASVTTGRRLYLGLQPPGWTSFPGTSSFCRSFDQILGGCNSMWCNLVSFSFIRIGWNHFYFTSKKSCNLPIHLKCLMPMMPPPPPPPSNDCCTTLCTKKEWSVCVMCISTVVLVDLSCHLCRPSIVWITIASSNFNRIFESFFYV